VGGGKFRGDFKPRPLPGSPEAVSSSVQSSALVRSGQAGVRAAKEAELGRLLVESPEIALAEAELLAVLDLQDPSLDRLRHELLNLAASGSSLEKAGVQAHFTRKGMAELLARFAGSAVDDPLASFQRAVADLRELAGHPIDARRLLERRRALSDRPNDGRGNI
jgi:DNA primase